MLPATTTRRNPLARLELFFDGSRRWPHLALRRIQERAVVNGTTLARRPTRKAPDRSRDGAA
jgi:hypothetical protein